MSYAHPVDKSDRKMLIIALVLAGLVVVAWYVRELKLPKESGPAVSTPAPVEESAQEPERPLYPLDIEQSADRDLVPLPPLDDSDSYFLLALVDLFGADIETVLVNDALIDRFVATVDNLTRSHVAERIRPVGSLPGALLTDSGDVDGEYLLKAENYQRYDALVDLVANTDVDTIVTTYRRFYPLLQESYERLGYPNAYFNDRVVEVIDHLLETPLPDGPVRLVRPHVLYEFADEELRTYSSGRKLLIRIGPENASRIMAVLQSLRDRVASSKYGIVDSINE